MDFAQQLKSQIDISSVIGEYVRLRRFGNRYSGLCPFHNEKTPSFSVYTDHQFFKCFGCDAKGDVFNFVMRIEGLTFWEALKKLAEEHGIPLPKQTKASDEKTKLRASLYDIHEIAAAHFRSNLAGRSGDEVRDYLAKRGVTAASTSEFGLGLADGSGRALLRLLEQKGIGAQQIEQSGLAGRRDDGSFYDRFRNRLMFPIQSESGKIIAFGGRAMDPEDKAKYMNSPETEIYKKSYVLYNLHRARKAGMQLDRMVLVEGYMDVIGAAQAGVVDAVATCGTALTVEQIRAMKRVSQNLHLNFDPDAAGLKAAERSILLLLEENVRVRIVELEGGLDPDEYVKEHGAEAYQEKVKAARTYFYWLADRARARFNMKEPQGRMEAFQFLVPAIQSLSEKLERAAVANDLAGYLGIETGLVLEQLRKTATERTGKAVAVAVTPARKADRILIPLLLSDVLAGDHAERTRFFAALRRVSMTGPAAPIYEVILGRYENGEPITFNTLHECLQPAEQDVLAGLVLDPAASAGSVEDGMAAIAALQQEQAEASRKELLARIRAAEREGRIAEALELARQMAAKPATSG
jgi:DNA primase